MADSLRHPIVLGLDPGKTTGYAIVAAGSTKNHAPKIVLDGVLATYGEVDVLFRVLTDPANYGLIPKGDEWAIKAIVIEDFKLYPGMEQAMTLNEFVAREWIGVFKYIAYQHFWQDKVHMRMASTRSAILKHPLCKAVSNRHARDAVAHALTWMVKSKPKLWNGRMLDAD